MNFEGVIISGCFDINILRYIAILLKINMTTSYVDINFVKRMTKLLATCPQPQILIGDKVSKTLISFMNI